MIVLVAKISQAVKDLIHEQPIVIGDMFTNINCVPDCNNNWFTTIEEAFAYKQQQINNNVPEEDLITWELIEHCPPPQIEE